jgi:hypothetical protein
MKWSWAKVSLIAMALAALEGCCGNDGDQDADQQDQRLYCNLRPPGVMVTVKGTAEYRLELNGHAAVERISYSDGQTMVDVQNPDPTFSVSVELEAGDLFQSSTDGYVVEPGSILAEDTFWPADGSPKTYNGQVCWDGVLTP